MTSPTFGSTLAAARKQAGLSQKELAERVKIDDKPISPQYLNDIEHDRRSPSSEQLVHQFAQVLKIDPEYLSFLAGRWPETIRKHVRTEQEFTAAFKAFRQTVKGR